MKDSKKNQPVDTGEEYLSKPVGIHGFRLVWDDCYNSGGEFAGSNEEK
jgi:hypothetical protein